MASNVYELSVRRGPEAGQSFPLTEDSVTIGRDPMADIVLSDPEVSRQHARLTRDEEGFEIQDLGSTNGTFVDGKRLGGEPVRVSPGTVITMGSNVSLVLEAPSEQMATVVSPEGVDFPEEEEEAEIATTLEPLPAAPEAEESVPEPPEEPAEMADDVTSVEFPPVDAPESLPASEEEEEEPLSFEEPEFDSDVSPEARTVLDMEVEETPYSFEPESREEAKGWDAQREEQEDQLPSFEEGSESELPSFGEEEAVYTPSGSESGAPPPPPPPSPPPKSNRNRNIIIAILVVLLLCCCITMIVGYLGYTYGDQIFGL